MEGNPFGALLAFRTCSVCGTRRLITEITRDERMTDGYGSVCIPCKDSEKQRIEHRANQKMARLLNQGIMEADNVPRLGELAREAVDYFGGMSGFVSFWCTQIELAAMSRPGGANGLNGMGTIAKLVVAANAQQPPRKKDDEMSNEEVQDTLRRALLKFEHEQRSKEIEGELAEQGTA